MRAYAVVHGARVEVGDDVADLQAAAAQHVLYAQLIVEREALVPGGLARQQEHGAGLPRLLHRELAQLGKAVLGHVVGLAVQEVLVVAQPTGHREQQRRVALPPAGIAVVHALYAV